MDLISHGRFGDAHPKPGYHYPVIRFPKNYQNLIGEQVNIFSTEFEGAQAFLVVTPEVPVRNGEELTNRSGTDLEKRLSALEQSISEIKELFSPKATEQISGGSDVSYGLAEIRTQDLRHVKATS